MPLESLQQDETRQEEALSYRLSLDRARVPSHLHGGLIRYFLGHVPPGSFLRAVLENDARMAAKKGGQGSVEALGPLFAWLNHDAPVRAWGDVETVEQWLAQRERWL